MPRKSVQTTPKSRPRPNESILNFFKKVEQGLFVGEGSSSKAGNHDELYDEPEDFWEQESEPKRRRLSGEYESQEEPKLACTSPPLPDAEEPSVATIKISSSAAKDTTTKTIRRNGPFVNDSESEEDVLETKHLPAIANPNRSAVSHDISVIEPQNGTSAVVTDGQEPPPISSGDFEGFESLEDFEEYDFQQGEEFQERRWMAQQEQLTLEDDAYEGEIDDAMLEDNRFRDSGYEDSGPISCPICNTPLAGMSDHEASVHVNTCLDGNGSSAIAAPETTSPQSNESEPNKAKRFIRPPKPAQRDPMTVVSSIGQRNTAFSKLMANHAENTAWASAAASEIAARGKPSYQRTCPFYKILPGFSICVDAFRYGAVEGCAAFFLSHFHSDHYIGLTSSWCHGPIYCSRITSNLVLRQLKVDPKWVVALEFEEEREVPGTDGVKVTMIPANHCPGSSLFLFEKSMGKGPNPRLHRVLHCGDFRACRAHVEHPLLCPDIFDAVRGKTRQQKIDVCYLDTTYLNPKYAFPAQEEVIKACADMCASLNRSQLDENDAWETSKRERAGSSMTKFLKTSTAESKDDTNVKSDENSSRGRLLVVVGTYSIGKERVCLGIARAMNSKIYASPSKQRICACLEDPELSERLTSNPREAQVHMTPLFEIRSETLEEYLSAYRDTFSRAVAFRPSGWNYRPPGTRFVESPTVQTVLYGSNWKNGYGMKDLAPQRGSTKRATCFGVPYSEHSSFRELTMFCCALRIEKIIPTVNVGSAKSREKMRTWVERWNTEKKKSGLFKASDF